MRITEKDRPSEETIQNIRARFYCEPEIDRILTRKMQQRSGPGYQAVSLDQLVEGTRSLIAHSLEGHFEIRNPRWLSGGASKIQMAFSLRWTKPDESQTDTDLVLRMEPAESLNETSRLREFQLLRTFAGVVPAPEAFWVDPEGSFLPYPALICGFVSGVTKPAASSSQVTGMGTKLSEEWRAKLGPQFVGNLAKIHGHPIDADQLSAFETPAAGTASAIMALDMWERVWEEDFEEDIPLMRFAASWMRDNAPICKRPCIVHADYRMGNFLFREADGIITAVLDWEGGRIGDFHQDLAWTMSHAYGQHDPADGIFYVGGLVPENEFLETYQKISGNVVDPKALLYYKVLTGYIQGVLSAATAFRVAKNGKTNQDVLQTLLLGISPTLLNELRINLEKAA